MTMTSNQGEALFRLNSASINHPNGVLLKEMEWSVPDHAVTVIFGPGGTGKSLLLQTLCSNRLPQDWSLSGGWYYRNQDLSELKNTNEQPSDIAWLPQQKRTPSDQEMPENTSLERHKIRSWRSLFESGAHTLLLDEPTIGMAAQEIEELVAALRTHKSHGAAIVVTHDQAFARKIADEVCLLCAGEIVGSGKTEEFFEHPPNDLVAQFVKRGSCSPKPPEVPLPTHFKWILPGKLAGMGKPGLMGDMDQDLTAIATVGISHLVTLTKERFPPWDKLRPYGISGRHFPITDMGVPAIGTTASLCRDIKRQMNDGNGVALHCHAGLGRTGTILACVLVWLGRSPEEAIKEIRTIGKGYIQNKAQSDFVYRFSEGS
ncbi:MAG: ATP-binding cassette domain-containing protein [Nitrospirae bacterium]|nr:ATP-binding cassette domain-containing protein [Candidatus Manganitrophaceae bacterium]